MCATCAGCLGRSAFPNRARDTTWNVDATPAGAQDVIAAYSADEFAVHVKSLVVRKREQDKQLRHEAARYFNEIMAGYYDFDRGPWSIAGPSCPSAAPR